MAKFDVYVDNIVKPIVTGGLIKPAANRYTSPNHAHSVNIDNGVGQRQLNTAKFKKIACGILSALLLLKKNGVIHADIKPENCFIRLNNGSTLLKGKVKKESDETVDTLRYVNDLPDEFDIRLGDFGNAIVLSEVASYFTNFDIQTLSYRAPEVLFGLPFGSAIDLWSCGVLLLELCMGKPLFVARSRVELAKEIESKLISPKLLRFSSGKYMEEILSQDTAPLTSKVNFTQLIFSIHKLLSKSLAPVPTELVHLIAGLLHPDPELRLTAIDALQHPFLAGYIPIPINSFVKSSANKNIALNVFRELHAKKTVRSGNGTDSAGIQKTTPITISTETVCSASSKLLKTPIGATTNLLQNLLSPTASAASYTPGHQSDSIIRTAQSTPKAVSTSTNSDRNSNSRKAYIREQTNSLLTSTQPNKANSRGSKRRRLIWNEISERYESSGGDNDDDTVDDDNDSDSS